MTVYFAGSAAEVVDALGVLESQREKCRSHAAEVCGVGDIQVEAVARDFAESESNGG